MTAIPYQSLRASLRDERFSHESCRVHPLLPRVAVKAELARLTELAGVDLRPEVFDVLVELTRLDIVPTATAQVLKSLCTKSAMRQSMGGAAASTGTLVTAGAGGAMSTGKA